MRRVIVAAMALALTAAGTSACATKGYVNKQVGSVSGKHTIELLVSDYQETKNMEDVSRILPNTRDYTGTFTAP